MAVAGVLSVRAPPARRRRRADRVSRCRWRDPRLRQFDGRVTPWPRSTRPQRPADDGYERHYAEKLWAWIPEIYRIADAEAQPPDVLRTLVEILGGGIGDWPAQHRSHLGQRADRLRRRLGRTIYRRSRGDPAGQRAEPTRAPRRRGQDDSLSPPLRHRDGSGGTGSGHHRLVRARRRSVPPARAQLARIGSQPPGRLGAITGTPAGGTADLRNARIADILDGPFDDMAHTPDFRRLAGRKGRYNIPKLNVHLFRQDALPIRFATPVRLAVRRYTLDPSGRDVVLFKPNRRDVPEPGVLPREWQIRGPVSCRLLNEASFRLDATLIAALQPTWQAHLTPIYGAEIRGTGELRRLIGALLRRPILANPPLAPIPGEPTAAHFAPVVDAAISTVWPKRNLIRARLRWRSAPMRLPPLRVLLGRCSCFAGRGRRCLRLVDPLRRPRDAARAPPAPIAVRADASSACSFRSARGTYDRHDTIVLGRCRPCRRPSNLARTVTGFSLPAAGSATSPPARPIDRTFPPAAAGRARNCGCRRATLSGLTSACARLARRRPVSSSAAFPLARRSG